MKRELTQAQMLGLEPVTEEDDRFSYGDHTWREIERMTRLALPHGSVLKTAVSDYRLWVNKERTVLVRIWANGKVEVATRPSPERTWGPPIFLAEEET